jgi:DNA adenine methylase
MAPHVVAELGPHHSYYEPFCGSCAVLFAKPVVRQEVVNDLNRDLANVAVVIQTRPLAAELLVRLHLTISSQELYHESRAKVMAPFVGRLGDADRAYHAMVTWWLGRNGMAGTRKSSTSFSARFTSRGGSGGVRFRNLVASVPFFSRRLSRVEVLNRDGFDVLEKIRDEPGTAIYLDPPYVAKSFEYEHDFAQADHARLARAAERFKHVRVVISYYPHPTLDGLYPADRWRRVTRVVSKAIRNTDTRNTGGVKATELLLVNGPPIAPTPTE